jgi:ribosome-associated toxin RatA of RatAB toxin-antitoxin module
MSVIHRTAVVHYTVSEMFRLVDAVEHYSDFLPWCTSVEVHHRTPDEVNATLGLAMGGFHRQFTTCNRLHQDKIIEIRLLNGPFHHLEGFWRFEEISEQRSRVVLDLEFELTNRLVNLAFEPVFHQVANSLVHAFVSRAEQVYGKRSALR